MMISKIIDGLQNRKSENMTRYIMVNFVLCLGSEATLEITILKNGVHETTEYLELFLRNLLLDEKNELHNRSMHISGRFKETDFESAKADIGNTEADTESQKADIRNKLLAFSDMISEKTINHTFELFSICGKEEYFGRTIVEDITGLKSTRASELIKLLVDSKVIVSVTGHGKGKYRFQL